MSIWIADGNRVSTVAIDDRGYLYGDGLFETIAIRNGEPRFWDAHIDRLHIGCERLGLSPPDPATLRTDLDVALAAGAVDIAFATAKIIVSAGAGPRGYARSATATICHRVGVFPATPLPRDHYTDGVTARLCQTRLAAQPSLAGLKTLNRLEQVLARAEWQDPAAFEGLQLDADDHVICGTMSNVFIVTAEQVATPAITRCGIAGIMRQEVLAELAARNRAGAVREIAWAELKEADEVFVTNSQIGILPVRRVDSQRYSVGTMTRSLMGWLAARGVVECSP